MWETNSNKSEHNSEEEVTEHTLLIKSNAVTEGNPKITVAAPPTQCGCAAAMAPSSGSQAGSDVGDLQIPEIINEIDDVAQADPTPTVTSDISPTDKHVEETVSEKPAAVSTDVESDINVNIESKVEEDAVSRISSVQGDMCRICHCVAEDSETLISPCDCCGSMKWVHQKCLQRWVKSRDAKKCELCGFPFNMTSSVKPFRKWKKLNMSSVERRRVLCSVTFHVVAITCVIWSLYVLIDRTTQEIQNGNLNWPFWTKLVVVAIGFTGGLVFMYVQCKTYVKLFRRWKQFNRVIYINDVQLPDSADGDSTEMAECSSSDIPPAGDTIVVIRMPEGEQEQQRS